MKKFKIEHTIEKNRDFLPDVKIVGAMLVSRCEDVLNYTIPSLMEVCDWAVIMFDNSNEVTKHTVYKHKEKYGDRIRLAKSNIKGTTPEEEKEDPRILFSRFNTLQGAIRDEVFKYFHRCVKRGEQIDMIVWPDSDEVFTDYFPQALEEFWAYDYKKALAIKPVDVFGDFKTIRHKSMTHHTRVVKYSPDLIALPYRTLCNYLPHTKEERMAYTRLTIHLAALTAGKRAWRKKSWRTWIDSSEKLHTLEKDVRRMSMPEIKAVQDREPDITAGEYMKKHGLDV